MLAATLVGTELISVSNLLKENSTGDIDLLLFPKSGLRGLSELSHLSISFLSYSRIHRYRSSRLSCSCYYALAFYAMPHTAVSTEY